MKVIKIGGGCLKGEQTIAQILDLIANRGRGHIFVVSALNGITDFLLKGMTQAIENEEHIPVIMNALRDQHVTVARHLIGDNENLRNFRHDFDKSLKQLERLYYGLSFTKEISPRMCDVISSFGERFAVELLASSLRCRGIQAIYCMPYEIGLITDGKFGDATADLSKTTKNFQKQITPLINPDTIVFIPGFFGVSENGDITTFGRGGSDYSAAVVAAAMHAESLEIWKDVAGFMSADPKFVPDAQLIPILSYEEAAELSYFGAKILHPRTVEPVRSKRIPIAIKNTLNPDAPGTRITTNSPKLKHIIKSVAHDANIGIIKVHSSGVGARLGILGRIADCMADHGINIKSVVTSQTCISLLLAHKDLHAGYHALQALKPKPYQRIEKLEEVALIGIVGEGLLHQKGIAAKCFTAVAEYDVNIEMISFGPSRAALYFLVRNQDLQKAVTAIHNTFFQPHNP
jgi:aspartate kinase